jgi:hypothetical protein
MRVRAVTVSHWRDGAGAGAAESGGLRATETKRATETTGTEGGDEHQDQADAEGRQPGRRR